MALLVMTDQGTTLVKDPDKELVPLARAYYKQRIAKENDMNKELATRPDAPIAEQVLIGGDLSKLSPEQRANYYLRVCDSVGLNPLTKPFDYIVLNGKLTLYAKRDATDQLRKLYAVSCAIVGRDRIEDVYVVTAKATTPEGRSDEATGAVALGNLKGEALANALMKAETKAKRRVTLSICGLGWTDETEIDSIPNAQPVQVDMTTGEIVEPEPVEPDPDAITCENCAAVIEGFTSKNNKRVTPEWLAKKSREEFGKVLCRDCGKQAKAAIETTLEPTEPADPFSENDN